MKIKKYGANWCAACIELEAQLKALNLDFEAINTDKFPNILKERNTNEIPFVDIFDDSGKLLGTIKGCPDSSSELLEEINKILNKNA